MRARFGVRRARRRFGFRVMFTMTDPKRRQVDALRICLLVTFVILPDTAPAQRRGTAATITIDTSRPLNRFSPSHALGAGIDGHEKGVNDLQLRPDNMT